MTVFVILLALSFLSAVGSSFSFNLYDQVQLLQTYYIGFASSNSETRTNRLNYSFSKLNLSLISRADDSPFESVKLPFEKFVLFGQKTERLFASANGGIHVSYVQPTPYINVFGSTAGPYNDTYHGVIGGFLTDLNPGNSSRGSISAVYATQSNSGLDYVSVNYSNIQYYDSQGENSFRIVLYEDSSIVLKYDKVYVDDKFPIVPFLISGLRPPVNDTLTYIDPSQTAFGSTQWGTSVAGVYPHKSTVFNLEQFTMCPVSMSWCISPSQIATTNSRVTLNLTTLLLSCADLLDYGIVLSVTEYEAGTQMVGNLSSLVKCNATKTGHDTFYQLSCALPATLTNQTANYYVVPVWREKTTIVTAPYTVLPVGSMMVKVVNGSENGEDQCYFNALTYGYNAEVCSDCEVCNFNTTCLDLPCPAVNSVLYEWPSCNNTCAISGADNNTYFVDPANVCCSVEEMDCGGICHGTQKVGMQDETSIMCCPQTATPDCLGNCYGHAALDACGVCQGNDTTGHTCFAFNRVNVSTGSSDNSLTAAFNVSLHGDPLTRYVKLTNKSNATVVFEFTVADENKHIAPTIVLPSKQTLKVNETLEVPITVSLTSLFNGSQSDWSDKTISVKYYRQVYPATKYTVSMPLFVSTTCCSAATDAWTVGCSQCSPSVAPSTAPTLSPTVPPSLDPTLEPTVSPTVAPSMAPSVSPSVLPSLLPSQLPTVSPSVGPTVLPSVNPSHSPTLLPTIKPSVIPTLNPTLAPSVFPTTAPTDGPTLLPSVKPSVIPSMAPSVTPSVVPSVNPSRSPTVAPSVQPSIVPSTPPTVMPTGAPTLAPSVVPTIQPSVVPSKTPSVSPSITPSGAPSVIPSRLPTLLPTVQPSIAPTLGPSVAPTLPPSQAPTPLPTLEGATGSPTVLPTVTPTLSPSVTPSVTPSQAPSTTPSILPSIAPSVVPSALPSVSPSKLPTVIPTVTPSVVPTMNPTLVPTRLPTLLPTVSPTIVPTVAPSLAPSVAPSRPPTLIPTVAPTIAPTVNPTVLPSLTPTVQPTVAPSVVPTIAPSVVPTVIPSRLPSIAPSVKPSVEPSVPPSRPPTVFPSIIPSVVPTVSPSLAPSQPPTVVPTPRPTEVGATGTPSVAPSIEPSTAPTFTVTSSPSIDPTDAPTTVPTFAPSDEPTEIPSMHPSFQPSEAPTLLPTVQPSENPSVVPSEIPTVVPSVAPSVSPSRLPSLIPTRSPSVVPSTLPTQSPTVIPTTRPTEPPTVAPSTFPTVVPSVKPTVVPSRVPSLVPTILPTIVMTAAPTTSLLPTATPTIHPTATPTVSPSASPIVSSVPPSEVPTSEPTLTPTAVPVVTSGQPTISAKPSLKPTVKPSKTPVTVRPSRFPSFHPATPSVAPTDSPSVEPTIRPSVAPSRLPTCLPTVVPSIAPTEAPSTQPTESPSDLPTETPSLQPVLGSKPPRLGPSERPTLFPTTTRHPTGPSVEPSARPSVEPTTATPTTVDELVILYQFTVSQVLNGIALTDAQSDEAHNAFCFAVIVSMNGTDTHCTVTSVADASSGRRLMGVLSDGVTVQYDIQFAPDTAYQSLKDSLINAITNGVFDAALQSYAVENDLPVLLSVTSSSVVVSDYSEVTSNDYESPTSKKVLTPLEIGLICATGVMSAFLFWGTQCKKWGKVVPVDGGEGGDNDENGATRSREGSVSSAGSEAIRGAERTGVVVPFDEEELL